MSQSFADAVGLQASMPERDRSQLPLWPELELELEQVYEERGAVPEDGEARLGAPGDGNIVAQPGAAASGRDRDMASYLISVDKSASAPGEHRFESRQDGISSADAELGQRLRAARERLELERDEVARRTHITTALIKAIEEGQFTRLGATVFARGYLRSYARAVDLPDAVVGVWESRAQRAVEDAPVPSLAATSPRRSSRQMANPIVYTLLTALIAVPAYYGVRQAQRSPLPQSNTSVEQTTVGDPATTSTVTPAGLSADAGARTKGQASTATPIDVPRSEPWLQPMMASMTPLMGSGPSVTPAPLDLREIRVRLTAPSWIEIVATDGKIIEKGLLPAGTDRAYSVARSTRLRIGDVSAVELRANSKVIDLAPYARANVATLTVDEAGQAQLQ